MQFEPQLPRVQRTWHDHRKEPWRNPFERTTQIAFPDRRWFSTNRTCTVYARDTSPKLRDIIFGMPFFCARPCAGSTFATRMKACCSEHAQLDAYSTSISTTMSWNATFGCVWILLHQRLRDMALEWDQNLVVAQDVYSKHWAAYSLSLSLSLTVSLSFALSLSLALSHFLSLAPTLRPSLPPSVPPSLPPSLPISIFTCVRMQCNVM